MSRSVFCRKVLCYTLRLPLYVGLPLLWMAGGACVCCDAVVGLFAAGATAFVADGRCVFAVGVEVFSWSGSGCAVVIRAWRPFFLFFC